MMTILKFPNCSFAFTVEDECQDKPGTFDKGSAGANPDDEVDVVNKGDFQICMRSIAAVILGHACAGIDVTSPEYMDGIEEALYVIEENV